MKRLLLTLAITSMIVSTSCKDEKKENAMEETTSEMTDMNAIEEDAMEEKNVQLKLEAKSGSSVTGSAEFTQKDNTVKMVVNLKGLKEGTHAIHIHETADCSAADGTSAGGHWNPTNQPHGKWGSADGYHKGDIGNLEADADGNATVTVETDEWCIGCGDANKDVLGHAIIVHEGVDDFTSQPSGDAGSRISCGGIIQ